MKYSKANPGGKTSKKKEKNERLQVKIKGMVKFLEFRD